MRHVNVIIALLLNLAKLLKIKLFALLSKPWDVIVKIITCTLTGEQLTVVQKHVKMPESTQNVQHHVQQHVKIINNNSLIPLIVKRIVHQVAYVQLVQLSMLAAMEHVLKLNNVVAVLKVYIIQQELRLKSIVMNGKK